MTAADLAQQQLMDLQAVEHTWAKDPSLWSIKGESSSDLPLGWLNLCGSVTPQGELSKEASGALGLAKSLQTDGITDCIVIGMGGSSMAAITFAKAIPLSANGLQLPLHVLDSTHPQNVRDMLRYCEGRKPVFVVTTKSGDTLETLRLEQVIRETVSEKEIFVGITENGSPLWRRKHEFRAVLPIPKDVGGRFSAFSMAGLFPLFVVGSPGVWRSLLDSALAARSECREKGSHNPGLELATFLSSIYLAGQKLLRLHLSGSLIGLGSWVEQLLAESLGKQGKGILPLVSSSMDHEHCPATEACLIISLDGEVPVLEHSASLRQILLPGWQGLGREMFTWEFAVALTAAVMNVNPFDQPDVEAAKQRTRSLLTDRDGNSFNDWLSTQQALTEVAQTISPEEVDGYFAILFWGMESTTTLTFLERLRTKVSQLIGISGVVGYGPRYLHSVGQLFKGGMVPLVTLVVVPKLQDDLSGLGKLMYAQALGDAMVMHDRGHRVIMVRPPNFDA